MFTHPTLNRPIIALSIVFISLFSISLSASPKPINDIENAESLSSISQKSFDLAEGTQHVLPKGSTVSLKVASFEFDSRWKKEFRSKVASSYQTKITQKYTQLLHDQFSQALLKSGVSIEESPESADYSLVVTIENLRINGPEQNAQGKTFVRRAGSAQISVQLFNAKKQLLLRIQDYNQTPEHSHSSLEESSRSFNYRQFKILFSRWAKNSVKLLSE
ncbi:MAG: hypothetical protein ACI93R_000331 [Flavobacteriales bacterium]|jgi:hypothetical protein